jgi:DNA-binding response OmpR family regulator
MAESTEPFILIVEDDPDHAALIEAAFKKSLAHARTHLVFSGSEARAYLARESPHHDWERCPAPSLIVLDLGLPDITGLDILEWMAEWDWLSRIPVIVFTASEDPEHERRAYELGARRYLRKPDDYGALVNVAKEELGLQIEPQERKRGD